MNLSLEETELFYKLYHSVLAYTNRRLEMVPDFADPDDVGFLLAEEKVQIRDAWFELPELPEEFLAEHPDGLSPDELAIVAGWRHRVAGEFYIFRYLKKYTIFLSTKPERLYGVLGLADPLEEIFAGHPLPIYIKGVLLPFQGRITYDGLLSVYGIRFGGGIRSSMKETYNRLKRQEGIVEQLVGPDGEPQMRTSLERRKPRQPAPDYRPAVDQMVAQAEKMRRTDTSRQSAALSLLRAAARVAQATLHQPKDTDEHLSPPALGAPGADAAGERPVRGLTSSAAWRLPLSLADDGRFPKLPAPGTGASRPRESATALPHCCVGRPRGFVVNADGPSVAERRGL